jgi:GTP cyclohydrolase II
MQKARQQFVPQSHALRALFQPLPQGVACAHAAKPPPRMDDAVKGGESPAQQSNKVAQRWTTQVQPRVAARVERLTAGAPSDNRVQIAVVFGPNLTILRSQLQPLLILLLATMARLSRRAVAVSGFVAMTRSNRIDHIRITSHPAPGAKLKFPITWGAASARERGPVIGTVSRPADRNVIGTHGGSYSVYRALAVSSGALDPIRRPDLTNTHPAETIGPFPQWAEPQRIVSLDPWGHLAAENFASEIAEGIDVRPSIAITRARLDLPELQAAIEAGRLKQDGEVVHKNGSVSVVKIAIDPVWYLPGLAERFATTENNLRRQLFEQTAGMFPELVTRPDLQVFLPPIGGTTAYLFGDVSKLPDHSTRITCRVHDECNGSDVFGSDICTCRPYLIHGIEECARAGQTGGLGIIIYNRKEGRALGEVTKFLVYNARKRQEGGDAAAQYFERTECVAGVQDARFQQLMPDVVHWLGLRRIDRFVSMSDMKHDALTSQGIEIVERVPIPDDMIPADAHVEIAAKKAAGYYTPDPLQDPANPVGRSLEKY